MGDLNDAIYMGQLARQERTIPFTIAVNFVLWFCRVPAFYRIINTLLNRANMKDRREFRPLVSKPTPAQGAAQ